MTAQYSRTEAILDRNFEHDSFAPGTRDVQFRGMSNPPSRKWSGLLIVLAVGSSLFLLHRTWLSPYGHLANDLAQDGDVAQRVTRMRAICSVENPFEREYGRRNLRRSRGYEGG